MEQINSNQPISRRNKIQMLELLNEYDRNPGMTVKAFCSLHQISEGSFYSARKRHRSSATSKQKSSGFISIGRQAFKESTGALFAEVNGIKLYQAVPADYLKALVL
jgi:hypothetical protein